MADHENEIAVLNEHVREANLERRVVEISELVRRDVAEEEGGVRVQRAGDVEMSFDE
jgi:hypothetical protein